jgi:ferritin-like metal-binding protein YciE
MKFFSANLQDLRELYNDSLQKALDMEQHITKALPTMVEKASDPELKNAFETHLRESETHVTSVSEMLTQIYGEAKTSKCKVLSSLVTEAEDSIKDAKDPSVRDAALIAAAQQVEHHEMAVYGTLRTWANLLGETAQAATLNRILEQEKNADAILTNISSHVNQEAGAPRTSRAA